MKEKRKEAGRLSATACLLSTMGKKKHRLSQKDGDGEWGWLGVAE